MQYFKYSSLIWAIQEIGSEFTTSVEFAPSSAKTGGDEWIRETMFLCPLATQLPITGNSFLDGISSPT